MGCKNTSVRKICQNCQSAYVVQAHRSEKTKFCSIKCLHAGRAPPPPKKEISVICKHCGDSFLIRPYRAVTAKFCSFRCGMLAKRQSIESVRLAGMKWRPKQPKEVLSAKKKIIHVKYRAANRDEIIRKAALYYQNNKAVRRAKNALARVLRVTATPPWADLKAIEAFYVEAARLTAETGVRHEIDHIHPIKHKRLCGLHVHWNLQILTRAENRAKSNKLLE